MAEERREYPALPLIGVGAVVFRGEEVLLVRRGNPPLPGTWSLPGGALDVNEDMKSAVKREVREECGIEVKVCNLLDIFEYIERDKDGRVKYHYIVFDFRAEYRSGTLTHASDALEARWVPLPALGDYRLTEAVLSVIQKGLKI